MIYKNKPFVLSFHYCQRGEFCDDLYKILLVGHHFVDVLIRRCCFIQMEVVLNLELEKDLLGFGDAVHVLAPKVLVNSMSNRLKEAYERYR